MARWGLRRSHRRRTPQATLLCREPWPLRGTAVPPRGPRCSLLLPARVDVGLSEALHRIDLLVHRGVEGEALEHPRNSDVVGDTRRGQVAVTVDTELVDTHGLV